MARGSIFDVPQYFCFKYTNISGKLMFCINLLLGCFCDDNLIMLGSHAANRTPSVSSTGTYT